MRIHCFNHFSLREKYIFLFESLNFSTRQRRIVYERGIAFRAKSRRPRERERTKGARSSERNAIRPWDKLRFELYL